MLNRRGPLSKLVSGSIGFAKEYSADRKNRKESENDNQVQEQVPENPFATPTSSHLAPPAYEDGRRSSHSSDDDASSIDEEEWAQMLDEMGNARSVDGTTSTAADVEVSTESFLAAHPPPPYTERPEGAIPMPVIIPQRRPESRHRGFIRAYAPVLQNAGIDQDTWMGFLNGFEKAIKANPVFHVLNMGVFVAGHAHMAVTGFSPIAMVATWAIHLSLETGRRGYLHYRQNGYLDKMNDEFFKPRGLFCLLVKYKPDNKQIEEEIDIESNIAKQVSEREDPNRSKWKDIISTGSGKTTNDDQLPEPAPLVFPELDRMNDAEKENAMKHFGHFASDYFDRRAQATFTSHNPNSKLPAAPQKEFASRYSDPNHAVNTGGLVSVLSGGKYNPAGRRQRRGGRLGRGGEGKRKSGGGPMKKMMKQDALYLMVVNLPTQEEMARAQAVFEHGVIE